MRGIAAARTDLLHRSTVVCTQQSRTQYNRHEPQKVCPYSLVRTGIVNLLLSATDDGNRDVTL